MTGKVKVTVALMMVLMVAVGVVAGSLEKPTQATNIPVSTTNPGQNIVSVQGEGFVRVVPDIAYVTLGVETSHKDMATAQKNNKEKMNNIMAELAKLGIKKEDIQTTNYSVYPDYQWEDNKTVLKGYRVSNQVRVKISKIDDTGKILDAIALQGANIVSGIQFTLADESKAYHQALQIALKDAEDKAKAMAGYFGYKNLKPVTITESSQSNYYPPMPYQRANEAADGYTPVSPGEMEIRAQVGVTFQY